MGGTQLSVIIRSLLDLFTHCHPVTPSLKASLFLTYDFLRLYVNAFAFQAAINRTISQARSSSNPVPIVLPLRDLAEAFDARFIYESIDAANSLLGTLNSFIDPVEGLKYMPIKYYLYIIYAAVFLFKVRGSRHIVIKYTPFPPNLTNGPGPNRLG